MAEPQAEKLCGARFAIAKARADPTGKLREALVRFAAAHDVLRKIGFELDEIGLSKFTAHDAIEAGHTLSRDKVDKRSETLF